MSMNWYPCEICGGDAPTTCACNYRTLRPMVRRLQEQLDAVTKERDAWKRSYEDELRLRESLERILATSREVPRE